MAFDPAIRALAALTLLGVALGGCDEERSTTNAFTDPRCLPFPWDALGESRSNQTPPEIDCTSTLDCPPPLTCRRQSQDGTGQCSLMENVPDPSAPAEVYEVPEFLLSVAEGDDYNLIEFTGVPPSATVLRCIIHICPPDADVLREAPDRCFHSSKIINLGLTNGLALSVLAEGPDNVVVTASILACGPTIDGRQQPDVPFEITAVGHYAICYAFDETSLVAVSAISNLSRAEVGSTGQDAYYSDCTTAQAEDGHACSYTDGMGDEILGVCVGGACCASCWSDRDCFRRGGSTCVQTRDLSPAGNRQRQPPVVAFCSDSPCGNRNGDTRCIARADDVEGLPDAGVADADPASTFESEWRSYDPLTGACAEGQEGEGPIGDGGVGEMGPGEMEPGEMGPPPEMGARDMGPPPDAGPSLDMAPAADRGPPPEMGPAPDMGPPRMP